MHGYESRRRCPQIRTYYGMNTPNNYDSKLGAKTGIGPRVAGPVLHHARERVPEGTNASSPALPPALHKTQSWPPREEVAHVSSVPEGTTGSSPALQRWGRAGHEQVPEARLNLCRIAHPCESVHCVSRPDTTLRAT